MREKMLVLYYPEADFVFRFAAYLEKRSGLALRCRAFSDSVSFYEYLKTGAADLLLVPTGTDLSVTEERSIPCLFFTEKSESREERELPVYRSMDKQIRQISRFLDVTAEDPGRKAFKAELLGFYSPVHGAGQSISAILMGMVLAEKAPTLLLNLERFSGLKRVLPQSEGTLSELLYFAKVQGDLTAHLREVTEYFGPLAYVPPAREAEDLTESRPEDWRYLLETLRDLGIYRYILVDIGDGIARQLPLLSLCERIYVPVREDEIALGKLTEWQEYLAAQGADDLLPRLRTYRLPPPAPDRMMEYRELRYGVWGRTIKALAEGEA
ncbi:MAG: hypothetical protein IKI82_05450 [Lachnospiraceae bacterium]|nr:hypothetical protein [Lachnospiraceae bacterium]